MTDAAYRADALGDMQRAVELVAAARCSPDLAATTADTLTTADVDTADLAHGLLQVALNMLRRWSDADGRSPDALLADLAADIALDAHG